MRRVKLLKSSRLPSLASDNSHNFEARVIQDSCDDYHADYDYYGDFDEEDETIEILPCVVSPPPNCPTSQDTEIDYFFK